MSKFDDMKKLGLIIAMAMLIPVFSIAQEEDDPWDFSDREGWSFGLNLGGYFANKASAIVYNGEALYDINDIQAQVYTIEERLNLNQQTIQQVTNLIAAEAFFIPFDSYPQLIRYNPGLMVGLHTGYRFNNENSVFVDINYANLRAADKFTLETNLLPDPSQGTSDIRLYNIIGEEDRLNIQAGYRAGLVINEDMNWYFEGGGSFLATRMVNNFVEIEGTTFDLWIGTQGGFGNIQGPASNLTATGLGFFGGTGIEVFFNDRYEAHLGLRLSRDQVVLGTFDDILWNRQFFFTVTI